MTKEEFQSLNDGDVVRLDYNGIVADYIVTLDGEDGETVVLTPHGYTAVIRKSECEEWHLERFSILKRAKKGKSKDKKPKKAEP